MSSSTLLQKPPPPGGSRLTAVGSKSPTPIPKTPPVIKTTPAGKLGFQSMPALGSSPLSGSSHKAPPTPPIAPKSLLPKAPSFSGKASSSSPITPTALKTTLKPKQSSSGPELKTTDKGSPPISRPTRPTSLYVSSSPNILENFKTSLDGDFERRLEDFSTHRKKLEKKMENEKAARAQLLATLKNMEAELSDKMQLINPEKKGAMASVRGLFKKAAEKRRATSSMYSSKTPLEELFSHSSSPAPATNKVFGVELSKLLAGESLFLPKIVKEGLEHLKRNHLNEKDLFVKEPNPTELNALIESIDATGNFNFSEVKDPHLVAGVIIEFLNRLPEPLLMYKLYDDLVVVEDLVYQGLRASMLHSLIYSVPTAHVMILRLLMSTLQQLCANSQVNRLNPVSLGRVFGPVLMKKKKTEEANNATSGADIPRLVVGSLIKEYSKIFVGDENEIKYVMKNNQQLVEAGTKDKLIEKLMDEYYQDQNFANAFIVTHRYFMTTSELFEKLAKMFNTDYPTVSRKNSWDLKIQKRILDLIQRLIEFHDDPYSDKELTTGLNKFLTQSRQRGTAHAEIIKTLNTYTRPPKANDDKKNTAPESWFYPVLDRTLTKAVDPTLGLIGQYSPSEIAQQLAIMDHTLFKLIPEREFLFKAFMKPETCPRFTKMVDRFNLYGNWVASEIVKRKELDKRVDAVSYFIKLASECLALQNFNSCSAILGGLNSFAVTRLKLTWEKIPKKDLKKLEKMQALFSMEKNSKTYREHLKKSNPPLIPYLALYAKDLFGLEENTENTTPNGLVNFAKMRKLYNTIKNIRTYKEGTFSNLKINTYVQDYIVLIKTLPDSELSTLSQECEARKPQG